MWCHIKTMNWFNWFKLNFEFVKFVLITDFLSFVPKKLRHTTYSGWVQIYNNKSIHDIRHQLIDFISLHFIYSFNFICGHIFKVNLQHRVHNGVIIFSSTSDNKIKHYNILPKGGRNQLRAKHTLWLSNHLWDWMMASLFVSYNSVLRALDMLH